jgi:hypothetical protein
MRLIATVMVALAVGTGAVACGGDGDDATGAAAADQAASADATAFRDDVNEMCRLRADELAAKTANVPDPPSNDDIAMLLHAAIDNFRVRIQNIDAMEPPARLMVEVDRLVLDGRRLLDAYEARVDTEIDAVVDDGLDADNPFDVLSRRYRTLGLGDCGVPA